MDDISEDTALDVAREALGRKDYAATIDAVQRVLATSPNHHEALYLKSQACLYLGDDLHAMACAARARNIEPGQWLYAMSLADTLGALRRYSEASIYYAEALNICSVEEKIWERFWANAKRANCSGRLKEMCRTILKREPQHRFAMLYLARILSKESLVAEAESLFWRHAQLHPQSSNSLADLGILYREQLRSSEAIDCFRLALDRNPEDVKAHMSLAQALLQVGRFDEGWQEYEWRSRFVQLLEDEGVLDDRKSWRGEDIRGKRLLVACEQGMGDIIAFSRFLLMLPRGVTVFFRVPVPLVELFKNAEWPVEVSSNKDHLPDFDVYCSLLSLPHLLGASVPPNKPYLKTDPARVQVWRERIRHLKSLKVGLVWQGDPEYGLDHERSVDFARLSLLGGLRDVDFISLQKKPYSLDEMDWPKFKLSNNAPVHDWMGEIDDYADTAALVECLDLIVTVDTSVAHLAGALGKSVWLLNRADSYFVWMLPPNDQTWYPSARQFRRTVQGSWGDIIDKVRAELTLLQRNNRSTLRKAV